MAKNEKKKGEKFTCDECGKTFDSERGLSVHESKMHGERIKKREPPRREELSKKEKLWGGIKSILSELNPLGPLIRRRRITGPEFRTESLTAKVRGARLKSYPIGQAQVFISKVGNRGYYEVSDPPLSEEEMNVYQNLLQNFYLSLELGTAMAENPVKYLEGAIWDSAYDLGLMDEVRKKFAKYRHFLERDGLGYGRLHAPMNDPRVEEISLTSYREPVRVIHRDYANLGWLETNIKFRSEIELRNYNQKVAHRLGKNLTVATPITDAITAEGHRISLTFGSEATHPGSSITIRKHREEPLTLAYLVSNGTLSPLMAAYLWQTLEWMGFPLISGGIGSGKTTMANAILMSLDTKAKMVTVEDEMELNLPHENWQVFHTRKGLMGAGEKYDIDLFDLAKATMRFRPNYVVVGEVRGEEIKSLIHTVALGHGGCCTMHGGSAENVLTRMKADPLSLSENEILLVWSISVLGEVITSSGAVKRRVKSIHELISTPEGNVKTIEMFTHDPIKDSFSPFNIDEVIDNSQRLRDAAELRGATKDVMKKKLKEKIEFLEERVDKEETNFDIYIKNISEFYR